MAVTIKHGKQNTKEKSHLSIVKPNNDTVLYQLKFLLKKDNPNASISNEKASNLICPACNQPEAYIYFNNPLTIYCNRLNHCGVKTPVIEAYPELNSKQNKAEWYLLSRGLNPSQVDYEQSTYNEYPTVCFSFEGIKQHRLIGDGLAPKDKWRFDGSIAGKVFQPKHTHASSEVWITEGIIDAYSLQQSGVNAISVLSASNLPTEYFLNKKDKTYIIAFDSDNAGQTASAKYAKFFKENGITYKTAVPKGAKDWNEALMKGLIQNGYLNSCLQQNKKEKKPLFIKYDPLAVFKETWLIYKYLPENATILLYGETGSYKSFIAIDMACSIATGSNWQGHKVTQGEVIYICGEGLQGINKRIKAWGIHNNITTDIPVFVSQRSVSILDSESATEAQEAVQELITTEKITPKLVIIDTLARSLGGDENSNKDITLFIAYLDKYLKDEFNVSILVVHHTGHESKNRPRGASAISGNVDASFFLKKDGDLSTLSSIKMKDMEKSKTLMFTPIIQDIGDKDDEGYPITSLVLESLAISASQKTMGLNSAQETVYSQLTKLLENKNKVSTKEILTATGLTATNFSKFKDVLVTKKLIVEIKKGINKFYSLPVIDC